MSTGLTDAVTIGTASMSGAQQGAAAPLTRVGIDLGGSTLRVGRVRHDQIQSLCEAAVPAQESALSLLDFLIASIEAQMTDEVTAIGIGVPSVVELDTGIIADAGNIPSWSRMPLRSLLHMHFRVPVTVSNDVNCFVFGEKMFGKARSCRHVVGLTLGTGLGAGLIIDNRLHTGANGVAGELGVLPYRHGRLEDYCASRFFVEQHGTTGQAAFARACAGDEQALAMFGEFGRHLAHALTTALLLFDPEMIVIGGSIAKAHRFFMPTMREALLTYPYRLALQNVRIERSEISHVAVLGAAAMCDVGAGTG